MSFKNVPIPEAAKDAGFTKLAFADDFDDLSNIDFSGEGKPGYTVVEAVAPVESPVVLESQKNQPMFRSPGLFSDEELILDEILSTDTDNLSPIEALLRIARWKKALSGK